MALNSTVRARIEKPTPEELAIGNPAAITLPNTFGNNWNDPAFRASHHKRQVLKAENSGALSATYSKTNVKSAPPPPEVTRPSALVLLDTIQKTREAVVQGLHSPPAPTSAVDDLSSTFNVDDKALRFFAYCTEQVRESAVESVRVRKVSITFYLSDESLMIQEKVLPNTGLKGGTLLKRQRVPVDREDRTKRVQDGADHITLQDFAVGSSTTILARRYLVYACDGFTRDFLTAIGVDVEADGPEPTDEYLCDYRANRIDFKAKSKSFETKDLSATLESLASKGKCAQHYPEETMRTQRFVRDSGKVLSFSGLWLDEDAQPGGLLRTLELRYFLEDDTVSLVERPNAVTKSEAIQKTFLSRRRVPISGNAAKAVELTFANRVNGQRDHFLGSSDRYYHASDLTLGTEVNIFGRTLLLFDCDGFTRDFIRQQMGVDVGAPIDISARFPKATTRPVMVPPPTGFGTEEDSLASCSIALKPPKKDLRGFHEHGSNSLRFEMKLHNPESPEDNLRKFLLTFFLADNEIQITELAIRNTGFTGGRFMKKQRVEKTKGQRDFFTANDLRVGEVVVIAGFTFVILSMDEHSEQYLKFESTRGRHPDELTQVNPERVAQLVAKFREFVQVRFYTNTEAFRAFDRDHDGFVSLNEMIEGLKANLITNREEEAAALVRLFDKSGDGHVSYKDFMEAVALNKDPELPTSVVKVEAAQCREKSETAARATLRRGVFRQLHDRFEARSLNVYETFRILSTMPRAYRGNQAVELIALTNGSRDTAITPVQLRRGLSEVYGVQLNAQELAMVLEFFFPDMPASEYSNDTDRSLKYAVRLPEFQKKMVTMSSVGHLQ